MPVMIPYVTSRPGPPMRKPIVTLIAAILLAPVVAIAIETPRIIPRSARIDRPVDQAYGTLKQYFSDASLSGFRLTSSNEKERTLVATRSGIDGANWNNWAFCKAPPEQMIYQFEEGTVAVTVKLEKSGNQATFATVSADFQGTYGLGSNESTIACTSSGKLEQDIIAVAGGPAKDNP
ncbi:MAG: hypothetical protein ACLQDV_10815 [Candidatus Binataceae bacterium]